MHRTTFLVHDLETMNSMLSFCDAIYPKRRRTGSKYGRFFVNTVYLRNLSTWRKACFPSQNVAMSIHIRVVERWESNSAVIVPLALSCSQTDIGNNVRMEFTAAVLESHRGKSESCFKVVSTSYVRAFVPTSMYSHGQQVIGATRRHPVTVQSNTEL